MSVAIQNGSDLDYSLKYMALLHYGEHTFNSVSILFFKWNKELK